MKTTIIIIFTIALIIFFDFVSLQFFENQVNFYEDTIDDIIDDVKNGYLIDAESNLKSMNRKWNEKKYIWNMLCDHSDIENITKFLNLAQTNFEANDYPNTIESLYQMKWSIMFTTDRYSLIIDNIF